MLLTPHTLVGVTIGTIAPNIQIAVPTAFLMHFAGDLVPHWDFFTGTKSKEEVFHGWRALGIMADMILAVAVGTFFTLYALWVNKNPYLALQIFLCGIAGVLPDAICAFFIYRENVSLNQPLGIIYKIQVKLQTSAGPLWGVLSQFGVMAIAVLVTLSSLAR